MPETNDVQKRSSVDPQAENDGSRNTSAGVVMGDQRILPGGVCGRLEALNRVGTISLPTASTWQNAQRTSRGVRGSGAEGGVRSRQILMTLLSLNRITLATT